MRKLFVLTLLLFARAHAAEIYLPEDEYILPPLLYDIATIGKDEDRVNATGLDHRIHNAQKGEWLDFGDSLNLLPRLSVRIIERENIQWAGGGVFQARIRSDKLTKLDPVYDINLTRGLIKVWVKPDSTNSRVRILTAAVPASAKDAVFWVSARPERTEIYLLSGTLTLDAATPVTLSGQAYARFDRGSKKPNYIAKDWDPTAMEVQIAAAYPKLVELCDEAQKDWEKGVTKAVYEKYRNKGWRKASRLNPNPK